MNKQMRFNGIPVDQAKINIKSREVILTDDDPVPDYGDQVFFLVSGRAIGDHLDDKDSENIRTIPVGLTSVRTLTQEQYEEAVQAAERQQDLQPA